MDKEHREDINRDSNVDWNDRGSDLNQYDTLSDKWNDIQESYFEKYPEIDKQDLFYDSGGFEGLLERISEVRDKTVEEIRKEIANW